MSRVVARPKALLDGSPNAGELLDARSDAKRYVEEASVFPRKFAELVHDVPGLAEPSAIRLAGSVGSPEISGQSLMSISGEVGPNAKRLAGLLQRARVRYGFDVIDSAIVDGHGELVTPDEDTDTPTAGKLLRVSRLVGNDADAKIQTLGLISIDAHGDPAFYTSDSLDRPRLQPIESPAQRSELTQIAAAGVDAVEWAFD